LCIRRGRPPRPVFARHRIKFKSAGESSPFLPLQLCRGLGSRRFTPLFRSPNLLLVLVCTSAYRPTAHTISESFGAVAMLHFRVTSLLSRLASPRVKQRVTDTQLPSNKKRYWARPSSIDPAVRQYPSSHRHQLTTPICTAPRPALPSLNPPTLICVASSHLLLLPPRQTTCQAELAEDHCTRII
jgi:hypothetical protein